MNNPIPGFAPEPEAKPAKRDLHALVPLPARSDMNTGLSAARPSTMLGLFGRPGALSKDCSPVTSSKLKAQIVTVRIKPGFSVTGWKPAIESLKRIFAAVQREDPDLYAAVQTAGMLCCRAVRGSLTDYSNHSWGSAIDLKIGNQLDGLGAGKCQQGILDIYPFFHVEGWFWGAGYSTRPDAMHMELADETVHTLFKKPRE